MTDTNEALETVELAGGGAGVISVCAHCGGRTTVPLSRIASLSEIEARVGEYDAAWEKWADHSLRRHECDWGYTERPGASFATTTEEGG